MSFFRFRLRQICDKDFVLLQIVLQKTEIMNQGKTVFAQIMSLIPRYEFDKSTLLPDQQAMSNQSG